MSELLSGLGIVGGTLGAFGKASANEGAQDIMDSAISMPGVDVWSTTNEALAGGEMYAPRALALGKGVGSSLNEYYQAELNKLLEDSYPGYRQRQGKFLGTMDKYMAGEIPEDVTSQIYRNTAGRSLFGGYSGAPLHRNLVARDLGLTSLDLQKYGMETFAKTPGMFPRVDPTDISQIVSGYMGPNANQLVNIRAQERAQRQQALMARAGMPGATSAWADYATQMGGMLTGAGVMGMMGGGQDTSGFGGRIGGYGEGEMPFGGSPVYTGGTNFGVIRSIADWLRFKKAQDYYE